MSTASTLSTEVLNKVNDLAHLLHEHQNTSDNYGEKLERLATKSADVLTEIQTLKDKDAKKNEVIKSLEIQLAQRGHSSKAANDVGCPVEYLRDLDQALRSKGGERIKFFHKSINPESMQKMQTYAANSSIIPSYLQTPAREKIAKDIFEGSNPNGGYWIIPEYSPSDVTRDFETSPMREICNVVTTSSNIFRYIIDDNLATSGGWVGEQQQRPSTETARIGELDIPIHEQYAEPLASHWMLDDAQFDLVGWINNKSRQTMDLQENAAFLVGDGSQKPRGILDYPAWGGAPVVFGNDSNYQQGALETIYSGVSGGFTYNGIVNGQLSLLEPYQRNATWLTTRQGWAQILQIKDTQDRPLFQMQDLLRTGAQAVLLGREVRIAAPSTAPILPTQPTGGGMPIPGPDAKALIYGDFREGYTIVDRIGFFTIVDMVTDKQWVKYYVRKRLGGALTSYQSLKVIQQTAAPGPLNGVLAGSFSLDDQVAAAKKQLASLEKAQAEAELNASLKTKAQAEAEGNASTKAEGLNEPKTEGTKKGSKKDAK